jgi:hypothetical protein
MMNQHINPSQGWHSFERAELDQKIKTSVDTDALRQTSIFAVGAGGANNIYENLVRLGVGKMTVVDFDKVSPTNLVTQGWYGDQLGKPKVEALRENAARLLPTSEAQVRTLDFLQGDFLKMGDEELEHLAGNADLLMFMADDFYAQARGNRLALKLQKPAIFAMMYEKARCCEVTFTIPGVTPACHRCATSSRYEAYLVKQYSNDITSDGSLIFQTHAINSIIGMVALAILHNDKPGYEFSCWFGSHWKRNLLQFRLSPRYESNLFKRVFGVPQAFCFDTVWQEIEPECAPKYSPCPDCGGAGDLRAARIADTRSI